MILLLLLLLLLLLSLLSQSLLVFFLCISRVQTMHLERQSLKSIIYYYYYYYYYFMYGLSKYINDFQSSLPII